MYGRNGRTGSPIKGTSEVLPGCANVEPGTLCRKDDGEIGFKHSGYTEVFWNGARTATNDRNQVLFVDEAGDEVSAEDIELYEAPPAADAAKAG